MDPLKEPLWIPLIGTLGIPSRSTREVGVGVPQTLNPIDPSDPLKEP